MSWDVFAIVWAVLKIQIDCFTRSWNHTYACDYSQVILYYLNISTVADLPDSKQRQPEDIDNKLVETAWGNSIVFMQAPTISFSSKGSDPFAISNLWVVQRKLDSLELLQLTIVL